MKRRVIRVVLFGLLVLAAAFVGRMIGGAADTEDRRAVIPVPFDTIGSAGTPLDSSAMPNRD